jgi:hypothetical protein
MFGPGTLSGIKVITITDGASRRFEYYPRARTDGLQTREEVLILEGTNSRFHISIINIWFRKFGRRIRRASGLGFTLCVSHSPQCVADRSEFSNCDNSTRARKSVAKILFCSYLDTKTSCTTNTSCCSPRGTARRRKT